MNPGVLLTAGKVVVPFEKEVRESLVDIAKPPTLVAILSTSAPDSRLYANFAKAQCENVGVKFVLKEVGAGKWREGDEGEKPGEGEGVEEAVIEANEDEECDGILVFYPIFGGRQVSLSCPSQRSHLFSPKDHYLQQACSCMKATPRLLRIDSLYLHSRTSKVYITSGTITCITSERHRATTPSLTKCSTASASWIQSFSTPLIRSSRQPQYKQTTRRHQVLSRVFYLAHRWR